MKCIRLFILLAGLLCASCGRIGDPPAKDKPKAVDKPKALANDPEEVNRLKGAWKVVEIEWAGQKLPDDRVQETNLRYSFYSDTRGDTVAVSHRHGSMSAGSFTIDTTTSPKKIILPGSGIKGFLSGRASAGSLKRPTLPPPPVKAIYSFEGNTLKLCLMIEEDPNAGYPTGLVSQASPETDLLTLERR